MSKLKLEVLFNAVDKVSGPIKTIIGGSKSMAAALKKTNTELKDLESQQRKVSGFRQLTAQSEKTAQALATCPLACIIDTRSPIAASSASSYCLSEYPIPAIATALTANPFLANSLALFMRVCISSYFF